MITVRANAEIGAPKSSLSARLSFIAIDKARRLFGLCPRLVATEICAQAALAVEGQIVGANTMGLERGGPSHQAADLIGHFGIEAGPHIAPIVPKWTASPFDALGKPLTAYGLSNSPTLRLDRIGVSIPTSAPAGHIYGFLELQCESDAVPTNGTLLIDEMSRGICILVGRVGASYLAVGLEECLNTLGLFAIEAPEMITDFGEAIDPDEGDVFHTTIDAGAYSHPRGQLFDILREFQADSIDGR